MVTIPVIIDTTHLHTRVYINILQYKCCYKRNRIKTNASTTSSSVTTITVPITIIRRIHYEISINNKCMSMSFSNLQTERNKLINRKQTASPSPNPNSTPSWMCRKTIANRRSDMPQRIEIKIKTKIPKRNHTSTHTYRDRLSATKRGGKRERETDRQTELSFSEPPTKVSP
jgi:hypothetical protein